MSQENRSITTTIDDEGSPDVRSAKPATAAKRTVVIEAKGSTKLSGKRAQLRIASTKEDAGKEPVFVGLNGEGYLIPRDVQVDCPIEIVQVLEDAKFTEFEQVAGGGTPTEIQRYNMSVRMAA